ncbi:MAG: hypothetical protein ACYC61_03345 [Isosphaeraceae bacterium]
MAKSNDQRGEALRDGRVPQLPGTGVIDPRDRAVLAEAHALDLRALLRRLLIEAETPGSKTWAQRVLEGWIVDAIEGDTRVVDGIFVRSEVDRPAAEAADETPLIVDERTTSTILEVLCGSRPGEASG